MGLEISNGVRAMKYGKLAGLDKPVSRIVQGTTGANSKELDASFALLDAAFEAGINTFDTAHVYGTGDNERTVGRWIRERGIRDKVVILAKGAHHSADRKRVTPYDISADIHDSLARFQVDHLDLYILHRDDPDVPVGPIVEVLNEHHAAGKIGLFGGSNWAWERVREANEYAAAHNLVPFTVSSPNLSLADMVKPPWAGCLSISGTQGQAAREWYAQQNMPLFTWSSMASGFFSGRFRRDNLDTFQDSMDLVVVNSYCSDANFQRIDRAQELANEKGVTLAQIAVSWLLHQPLNVFALLAPRTAEEVRLNVAALELELSQAEMDWIDLKQQSR
jgi:aryl-alcohol dehydrogenase-like predicted oxidoreductase